MLRKKPLLICFSLFLFLFSELVYISKFSLCSCTDCVALLSIPTIAGKKQVKVAAEEEQNQPEAEQQEGSPQEENMEINTGDDVGQDPGKLEKEKRQEAKVSLMLSVITFC